jgi:hypothetical protein
VAEVYILLEMTALHNVFMPCRFDDREGYKGYKEKVCIRATIESADGSLARGFLSRPTPKKRDLFWRLANQRVDWHGHLKSCCRP